MALAAAGYLPPVAGAVAQEVIDVLAVVNALRVGPSPDDADRLLRLCSSAHRPDVSDGLVPRPLCPLGSRTALRHVVGRRRPFLLPPWTMTRRPESGPLILDSRLLLGVRFRHPAVLFSPIHSPTSPCPAPLLVRDEWRLLAPVVCSPFPANSHRVPQFRENCPPLSALPRRSANHLLTTPPTLVHPLPLSFSRPEGPYA